MEKTFSKCCKLLAFVLMIMMDQSYINAQGCVAIRSGCGNHLARGAILSKGDFESGTNFRYFHSYKHFRGKHEETERVENATEVINDSFFLNFQLRYGVTDRLTASVILPFVYHERSSMYEHGGNPPGGFGDRHSTFSHGLSDIRLSLGYWLFDPGTSSNPNLSIGLGLKLPTGDYRYQGKFYNQGPSGEAITSGVDQSIQPGDGGLGMTIEMEGFYLLNDQITLSTNLYYLINPREQYQTTNFRGATSYLSVPDQYAARIGGLYMLPVKGLRIYAGSRIEGIPSRDLIGGNEGFRRPGYIVSLEPGINYSVRNFTFNLTVPVAIERARTQNFSDKQRTRETGVFRNGDAAFADYLINAGFSWRFGRKKIPAIDAPLSI